MFGGWFLVELVSLDFSAGIVHPYYSSALGPGTCGDGRRRRRCDRGAAASASDAAGAARLRARRLALAGTLVVQLVLIHREGDPLWWRVPLVLLCSVRWSRSRFCAAGGRGRSRVAVAALLVAPMVFSFSVWLAPVERHLPRRRPLQLRRHGGTV